MSDAQHGRADWGWLARAWHRAAGLATLVAVSLAVLAGGPSTPRVASAAPAAPTFSVNNNFDVVADFTGDSDYTICRTTPNNNICTLRAAIMNANRYAAGGASIILPSGAYTLTLSPGSGVGDAAGNLDLASSFSISGAGPASTIIDAGGIDNVFALTISATVAISGVTIRNGNTTSSGGGGIFNNGALTLTNSSLHDNHARSGGAGGGIFNGTGSQLTINSSAISHNDSSTAGGGIYNAPGGTLTVNNSTIAANYSALLGGGLYNGGALTMNDSTISANATHGYGGGIRHFGSAAQLFHVTIAGNLADAAGTGPGHGGGIAKSNGPTFDIANSLVAENHAGSASDDCVGDSLISLDYNYIQSMAGCTLNGAVANNLSGGDALLGPLQDNGGPTPTRALLTGSPALDQIPTSQCRDSTGANPHPDQRGVARPVNGLCDMGAYEGVQPLFAFNRNLIRNGDAESGGASPSGAYVGAPNWLVGNGHFTAVPYNATNFPNLATDMVPADHGYNFFAGGDLTDTVASQFIDLTPIGPTVDAGGVPYTLSADLGGFQSQDDAATVTATFLDMTFAITGTVMIIGPVTAAERGNQTGFVHQSATALIPAGARTVEIDVRMIWTAGYNDGYADNISFVLPQPQLFLPLVAK